MALYLFCFLVDSVQGHVKEDGFLTPAEEAEWSSAVRLGENEAQPRLKRSSFLCFNTELQQQVHSSHLEQWSKHYGSNNTAFSVQYEALDFIHLHIERYR